MEIKGSEGESISPEEELLVLREENQRLRHEIMEGRKVQKQVVTRIVPPHDYEQLKRRCAFLEKQNHSYRSIIEHGSITTLERLVEKYIQESKSQLRKIIGEVSVTSFSGDTANEVRKLIEHLDNTRMHLHTLIAVQSGGNYTFHPKFQSAMRKAKEISKLMDSLENITGLSDLKADELLVTLTNMLDYLYEFLAEVQDYDD